MAIRGGPRLGSRQPRLAEPQSAEVTQMVRDEVGRKVVHDFLSALGGVTVLQLIDIFIRARSHARAWVRMFGSELHQFHYEDGAVRIRADSLTRHGFPRHRERSHSSHSLATSPFSTGWRCAVSGVPQRPVAELDHNSEHSSSCTGSGAQCDEANLDVHQLSGMSPFSITNCTACLLRPDFLQQLS